MRATVSLMHLSHATRLGFRASHTQRLSMLRPTNALQPASSPRPSARPVPRSFIAVGAAPPPTAHHHLRTATLLSPAKDSPDFCSDPVPSIHASTPPLSSTSATIVPQSDGVLVRLQQRSAFASLRWLRDHCKSPAVYDVKTNSRLAPVPLSSHDWQARDVAVDHGGASLHITWSDGRRSSYSALWLAATLLPKQPASQLEQSNFMDQAPVVWEGQPLLPAASSMPRSSFPTVSNRDLALPSGFLAACSHLHRFGFVFVDELPASESATRTMIERFGVLRNSMFGAFWTFEANCAMDDLA